ncbi:Outer membrane receptor for ferrienterochelin and colicins [Maribacter sedimenticola]|uniref:Outer membrane receptor for ferrienterochelin and colicins n=1 Tax=Maribacter sedimenticola TaxID=228956 RepID=A0ABY1SDX8_9FLAO|nr:TonB-dependent receptor [Maribacter sedimenticola]SNR28238.1 Outer membrane receptor for ferrienterochelin and colicins [Maribacter sedimenticola]
MRKQVLIIIILSFIFGSPLTFAQEVTTTITGKVIEENGGGPIEFATVLVGNPTDQKPIVGTTTLEDGSFILETDAQNFYIEVSFIGFTTKRFDNPQINNAKIDLGTVTLAEDSQQLDEVVVEGEVSQTTFKLDKRIFNVGADLSSTGASALEVLNNVPSVNVNIEGQISLRGSQGVQMLINGKPSVIANEQGNALGTLTADMIERIEVITNPSAKYDAEGTSGIINIVLKKEEKKGLNGAVTLNTGVPNNHSIGLSLNRRTEKFNLFSQMGFGRRTFPSDNETENRNLSDNTYITSNGESDKNETFFNLILGTDYHINDLNVITLSGNFAYEWEKETSDALFSSFDTSNERTDAFNRNELTTATNPKYSYELQYKKDFEGNEEQSLLLSATGNLFAKDQSSDFINTIVFGAGDDMQQRSRTDFSQADYTFKADYTHPWAEKYTLETGAQYQINDVENDFAISDFDGTGFIENPDLTNVFEWTQKVLGIYATTAYESDAWGLKLGLRFEDTDLATLLRNTNESNDQNYNNIFPSGHTSYKFSDNLSLQAGYSKRIFRPRMWDLNPFFNIRNNFSIRTGNPNLQPEFTDSYEITSIYKIGKVSMNFGVFYRHTEGVVERIVAFEDNVSISRPENIGINNTTGIEFNAKYIPTNWLSFTNDFNYSSFKRDGDFEGNSFDFKGDQWSTRLTNKVKLPSDFDLEFIGQYQSGYRTLQQEIADNLFMDFGARKKIFKGKAILSLSVRDVFASRIRESITNQPGFYLRDFSQQGRFITFGVSFGFGKGEAMEFSGQKHF